MKVLLFGAGINGKKVLSFLKEGIEIIAILDNDKQRWGNLYEGISVISPEKGIRYDFDYLIVTVRKGYEAISEQMINCGVQEEQIVIPFSFDHDKYHEWRAIFNIEELIYMEMQQKMENLSYYLENLEYEIAAKIKNGHMMFPKVLSAEAAIDEIIKNKKSMSRYGDGEWDLALGRDNSFQKSDGKLRKRLK